MGKLTVVGLFASSVDAQNSVIGLFNAGLPVEDIGFLEPADLPRHKSASKRTMAASVLGASSLAIAGGLLAAHLIGLSNIAGALGGALLGVGFGAYAGAILGGFFGTDGLSDDETYFMREVRAGRIMVAARVADYTGEARAAAALHDCNALEVNSLDTALLQAPLRHPTGRSMLAALVATDREVATDAA